MRQAHAFGQNAPHYTAEHAFSEACIKASHRVEAMIHILKMEALAMSHHEGLGAQSTVRNIPPDILLKFHTPSLENV